MQIPGYRLLARIASGASGTVHRALQENLQREVALKLLEPGLFDAEETRARFFREAKLQASLSHPNLLAVYDAGTAGGRPYLAVELIEGGSLRDRLSGGALPPAEAARLGAAAADGLSCAHEAGIVHRDLKPENVLLTREGVPKLADFGLAKAVSAEQTVQTAGGIILGTPGYMAPEVIRGEPAGPAADVYGLGVMLYEMLAGRAPWSTAHIGETFQAQLEGRCPALPAGVPRELASVVSDCLQLVPERRPSAAAVSARLGQAAGARVAVRPSQSSIPTRIARPEPPAPRRSRGWLALPVAIAIAAAAFWAKEDTKAPKDPPAPVHPPARPPPVGRITAGASAAHVWLREPAPEGLKLSVWRKGASTRSQHDFPPGASDLLLRRLEPSSDYAAELLLAGESVPCAFTTLASAPPGIEIARGALFDEISLLRTRDRLGLVWRRRHEDSMRIQFCDSADGGVTWSEPETLFGKVEAFAAAAVDGRFVAASIHGPLSVRSAGPPDWRWSEPRSPTAGVPARAPVLLAPDGHCFAGFGEMLGFTLLAGPAIASLKPCFALPSEFPESLRLAFSGSRWHAVRRRSVPGSPDNDLAFLESDGPGLDRWKPETRISAPDQDVDDAAIGASPWGVVVCYEADSNVFTRVRPAGASDFGKAQKLGTDKLSQTFPRLVTREGQPVLVTMRTNILMIRRVVDLWGNLSAEGWTSRHKFQLPLERPGDLAFEFLGDEVLIAGHEKPDRLVYFALPYPAH